MRALRRDPASSEQLPAGRARAAGLPRRREPASPACGAIPGQGTNVPLYILGSSLFGAQLAAAARPALRLRLALRAAGAPRRGRRSTASSSQPSAQLEQPYVIAGVNVIAADDRREAPRAARGDPPRPGARTSSSRGGDASATRRSTRSCARRRAPPSTKCSPTRPSAPPEEVAAYLDDFQRKTGADELITVHYADSVANRVRSVELLAEAAAGSDRSSRRRSARG